MNDLNTKIGELSDRLDKLISDQKAFIGEIKNVQAQINELKALRNQVNISEFDAVAENPASQIDEEVKPTIIHVNNEPVKRENVFMNEAGDSIELDREAELNQSNKKSSLENFIGENIISKIGIAITVFGVAIGVKYAIENDYISPLTRIIFGYLFGIGLFGFALKLKEKYTNYSSVLLGGSMAIMYFVTFAAYSFYGLFPQILTFFLMFLFTVFTVIAALNYNKQIIALIGLVGAYAVPFLLSDGSGRVVILFTYMAIINIGILRIAFQKSWKILYYSSFVFTWLIFLSWYNTEYVETLHFTLACTFLFLFFIIFYTIFLAYKLIKVEKFSFTDVILLLSNSFIFFGIGYSLLLNNRVGIELLGLFTLLNALLHFAFSYVIYRKALVDKSLFYLSIILVLAFITIAFPVQLNGNWVTILWVIEAVLLFWIARYKQIGIFEKVSYALMVLSTISLVHDWLDKQAYFSEYPETRMTLLFNANFFSALLFLVGFGLIYYFNDKLKSAIATGNSFLKVFKPYIILTILLVLYFTFRIEISTYWTQLYIDSEIKGTEDFYGVLNYNLIYFRQIWLLNYTLFYVAVLSFINIYKFKNRKFGIINLSIMTIVLVFFLTRGLLLISDLRYDYLTQQNSDFYTIGSYFIWIRYISIAFVTLVLYAFFKYFKATFMLFKSTKFFDLIFYVTVLWISSSELINWMDLVGSTESYKLGLSILWGIYSLVLICVGIIKKRKYLRVGAIVLFGFTLLKLFFYDIAYLDVVPKVIVLVSLGILMLIISFIYNKYKHLITDES